MEIYKLSNILKYKMLIRCLLDETISDKAMALNVTNKTNNKMKYLHFCNAFTPLHFDYECSACYPSLTKNLNQKNHDTQSKTIKTYFSRRP